MSQTPRWLFDYLEQAQAQKHLTVNKHSRILDLVVGGQVLDRDLTAPPGSPSDGDLYIPKATATGVWAGLEDKLLGWIDGAWLTITPPDGFIIYVKDENVEIRWDLGTTSWLAAPATIHLPIVVGDEGTDLAVGTAKVTFRMPYAFTLKAGNGGVRANVNTAPTGSGLTVDINEAGVSILSTKLTIDASEKTSMTAAAAVVISDTVLADDAEITIDIDGVGSTVPGKGLKVTLIGNRA